MITLSMEQFTKLNSRSPVECKCEQCNSLFYRVKHDLQTAIRRKEPISFCSPKCYGLYRNTKTTVKCLWCKSEVVRIPTTKNVFCSRSCSAKYNNTHKTFGTRRSKLERFLEEQIKLSYPNLELICNSKSVIGSELDFYFPRLRLAIELNGILHYEPIYGTDKFSKIVDNDRQKVRLCEAMGIELAVINSSSCSRMSAVFKTKYLGITRELIDSVIDRGNLG